MKDWELWFFLVFLGIQVTYPLLRYAKFLWRPKQSNLYGDYFWFFSWTMKLKATAGFVEIRVFDKKSGETILRSCPKEVLPPRQYKYLYAYSTSAIQYAKYIEQKFQLKEKNYGLNMYIVCDYNGRGPKKVVDDSVDFTKEKIKTFGTYSWYLDD